MKLAIALPAYTDREYSQFWDSFNLIKKPDYNYVRPSRSVADKKGIDAVRNELVKRALEMDSTHMIMMDTDQVYPPDTILEMIKTMELCDCKVVGTVIYRRYPPFDPLVFLNDKNGYYKPTDEEIYKHPYLKVKAIGCGCVLYDLQVFTSIPMPWFEDKTTEIDKKTGKEGPGEDFDFCQKLERYGYEIWVNTELDISHLALFSIDRKFNLIWNKLWELSKGRK